MNSRLKSLSLIPSTIKLLNSSNNSALMQGVVGTGTLLLDLEQKGSLQFTTLIYRRKCCC